MKKSSLALRMFMLYSNNYIMSHCLLFNIYIYKVTNLYNQNGLEKKIKHTCDTSF